MTPLRSSCRFASCEAESFLIVSVFGALLGYEVRFINGRNAVV